MRFTHKTLNHFNNFINPQSESNIQAIELLCLKNTLWIVENKLESLLSEWILKSNEGVFAGFDAVLILLRIN